MRNGFLRVLCGAALALALTLPAQASVLPRSAQAPEAFLGGITTGGDGNLWFTEQRSIGRMTPAGRVTHFALPVSQPPSGFITAGADGNVWFTDERGIGRISRSGRVTIFPVRGTSASYRSIAPAPDGTLWFLVVYDVPESDAVARITARGQVTIYRIPSASRSLGTITAGPDGAMWFTEGDPDKVVRVSLSGVFSAFPVPGLGTSSVYPTGIARGPDGNLWFTQLQRKIDRISSRGRITEFPLDHGFHPPGQGVPEAIISGPDGKLWFSELFSNVVGRITPDGRVTEIDLPTTNAGPVDLTIGPDRNVWVTATCSDQIDRITPSGHITEFPVSRRPRITADYCLAPL